MLHTGVDVVLKKKISSEVMKYKYLLYLGTVTFFFYPLHLAQISVLFLHLTFS